MKYKKSHLKKQPFKSLFLPRVAEFIYIEGDNKIVINKIYNSSKRQTLLLSPLIEIAIDICLLI